MSTPKNSLVACWDAGGRRSYPGAGTAWDDVSGNKYNGTLENGPTFDSANGGSIVFDGSSDYVDFNISTLPISTGFSVAAVVRPSTDVSDERSICSCDGGSAVGRAWILRLTITTGEVDFGRFDSSNVWQDSCVTTGTSINDNMWHHVVATFNTTVGSVVYIDGVSKAEISDTTANNTDTDGLSIGRVQRYSRDHFLGDIALVQIYKRALTAAEIRTMFYIQRGRFGA